MTCSGSGSIAVDVSHVAETRNSKMRMSAVESFVFTYSHNRNVIGTLWNMFCNLKRTNHAETNCPLRNLLFCIFTSSLNG